MTAARWSIVLAIAACSGPRFQHAGPASPSPIDIERITLRWSNVYLIHRGNDAVLVDSGSPVDRDALGEALVDRGIPASKVKAVVVTHAHADHAGCARWLQTQGAAIVLGAGDAPTAAQGRNEPLRPTGLLGALLATVFMFPFDAFTPDVMIDHEIDLAAYGFPELHVIPSTGHTAGSIAVLLGTEAFAGDMLKGGELLTHSPTEHLYQTDRIADHRALAALLDRGVTRLYLGHSGPLNGAEVRAWLADADDPGHATAVSLDLDLRGELPRHGSAGGTSGVRLRYAIGRAGAIGAGYVAGVDLRAGYLSGGVYEADAHPIGLAVRSSAGGFVMATGGVGIGGIRSNRATHALAELDGELPLGPVRLLARASLGWRLGGPRYATTAHGLADELVALIGVRLGRDQRWGDYRAGKGPYLAFTYRDLGGAELFGLALGVDLFAGR